MIDYLGTLVLSAAVTSLIPPTSLGGTTNRGGRRPSTSWERPGIGVFVLVERRAAEPVLPLHLFSCAPSR